MTTDRKNKMEFKTFIRKKPTAFDKEAALKKMFVTSEAIKDFVNLPDKTEIYDITRGLFPDTFIFYLEHPDFEELEGVEDPPVIDPPIIIKGELPKIAINVSIQDKNSKKVEFSRQLILDGKLIDYNTAINMVLIGWGKILQSKEKRDEILKSVKEKLNL